MGKIEAYIPNVRYPSRELHKMMLVYLLAFTEDKIIVAVIDTIKDLAGLAVKNTFTLNNIIYPNSPDSVNAILSENATKLGDFLQVDPDKLLSSDPRNFAIEYNDISRGALVQSRNLKLIQTESRIILLTSSGKSYEFMLIGMSKLSLIYQAYTLDDNTFKGYVEIVSRFLGDRVKIISASDPLPKVTAGQFFGSFFKRKKEGKQQAEE